MAEDRHSDRGFVMVTGTSTGIRTVTAAPLEFSDAHYGRVFGASPVGAAKL